MVTSASNRDLKMPSAVNNTGAMSDLRFVANCPLVVLVMGQGGAARVPLHVQQPVHDAHGV